MINSAGSDSFRLFITYPKFEFWLLLHKESWLPNIKQLTRYPFANRHCSDEFNKTFGHVMGQDGKKISDEIYDEYFFPHLSCAIARSKEYCTDVAGLMSEPGTNVGLLIEELCNQSKLEDM